MPIQALKLIRKMRGGAQSHLLECSDGGLYVVKFINNPQHRRILINEWLANAFLRYLQIHVPETSLVEVNAAFLAENPDIYFLAGSHRVPVVPGLHFGSRLSVHPDRTAIFDFLPDKLLGKVENRREFLGTLVFDKWVGNADSRQAVFFRAHARDWTVLKGDPPPRVGFFAQMIDHGFSFNGPHWQFNDSPVQGLYFRTSVYDEVRSLESFQPWLDLIKNFPEAVVDSAWKQIPGQWLDADSEQLEHMLEQLIMRRRLVSTLVEEVRRHRPNAFINWL